MPAEGEVVGATCGLFVKLGEIGDGTRESPYGSIHKALMDLGSATRIYICGGDAFAGSLELDGKTSLIGGFDCADWRYSKLHPRPSIEGDADLPALSIQGTGTTHLVSIDVEAPAAVGAGASSIAMLVAGATVHGDEMDIFAGDGADGEDPPPQEVQAGAAGTGLDGADHGQTPSNAIGGLNMCQSGAVFLSGGSGGKGGNTTTGAGPTSGQPGDGGNGGAAGGAATTQIPLLPCSAGTQGSAGMHGAAGPGATASGQFSASGFVPAEGGPGMVGSNGRSGGGGGGARERLSEHGPGGGGGGAGGCYGNAGVGGKGGGSSIAVVALSAQVDFTDAVRLRVAAGGRGGDGEKGQAGQPGGSYGAGGAVSSGGSQLEAGCRGGAGGDGGAGGNGGGGRGGHAVTIVYMDQPVVGGQRDTTGASAGSGGLGGDNGLAEVGGNGEDGLAQEELAI